MLKLTPNPTFSAKVDIYVPGVGNESVELLFKYKTKPEYDDLIARASDTENNTSPYDVMLEILAGWPGVEAEFSSESLKTFLESYHFQHGENGEQSSIETKIFSKYVNELTGARLGN